MREHYAKVYTAVNGSLVYLSGCIEKLTTDANEIKDMVRSIHDRSMAEKLMDQPFAFPLSSTAEVDKYLSADPKCEAMLQRYIKHAQVAPLNSIPTNLNPPSNSLLFVSLFSTAMHYVNLQTYRFRRDSPANPRTWMHCDTSFTYFHYLPFPFLRVSYLEHTSVLFLFRLIFRLLEVPYDERFYPTKILLAIFTPNVIKDDYTWPGWHKTCSRKTPLPEPIKRVLIAVGRHRLKGKSMTLETFIDRLRQRFANWKMVSLCFVLKHAFDTSLDTFRS